MMLLLEKVPYFILIGHPAGNLYLSTTLSKERAWF
jgi:hypothetical protein